MRKIRPPRVPIDPSHYDPTKHNYIQAQIEWFESHPELRRTVTVVNVKHDDGCAIFDGCYCNCNPEFEVAE